MNRKVGLAALWGATFLAVGLEVYGAVSGNGATWTQSIVAWVPAPVTLAAVGLLTWWLPRHFTSYYQRRAAMSASQTRYPWRATLRTVVQVAVAAATVIPYAVHGLNVDTATAGVAQLLAVCALVTRVMAMPPVESALRRFAPWLAAEPAPVVPPRLGPTGLPGAPGADVAGRG